MKTNGEKFNHWKSMAEKRAMNWIKLEMPVFPKQIYAVDRKGGVQVLAVEKIKYDDRRIPRVYSSQKPTRKDVRDMMEFCNSFPKISMDNFFIFWKTKNGKFTESGATKMDDLLSESGFKFLDRKTADRIASQRREVWERDYMPRDGYAPCAYCSKQKPEAELITRKIISYANYGPSGRLKKYCSGNCAASDQMGHEG